MMDRKDHVINTLTQLNDDLRNKLINLSADAGMQLAAKDEQIAKLTEALKKPPLTNGQDHLEIKNAVPSHALDHV